MIAMDLTFAKSNVNMYSFWWRDFIAENILYKKYYHDNEQEEFDKGNKDNAFDMFVKHVCSILNIPYLKYSGVVTYSFAKESKKKAYNINMFHGKAGGGVENALRKCKEMANKVNSDIYLMGHCHHKAYTTRCFKQIDSRNGKIVDTLQYFILTGDALNYDDSYADQANLEISHKDFPIIKLSNNGRKSISVY